MSTHPQGANAFDHRGSKIYNPTTTRTSMCLTLIACSSHHHVAIKYTFYFCNAPLRNGNKLLGNHARSGSLAPRGLSVVVE